METIIFLNGLGTFLIGMFLMILGFFQKRAYNREKSNYDEIDKLFYKNSIRKKYRTGIFFLGLTTGALIILQLV